MLVIVHISKSAILLFAADIALSIHVKEVKRS